MNEFKAGLWQKESKNGNKYYSGKIKLGNKEYYITLFDGKSENEKAPKFNLIMREKGEEKLETQKLADDVFEQFASEIEVDDEVAF